MSGRSRPKALPRAPRGRAGRGRGADDPGEAGRPRARASSDVAPPRYAPGRPLPAYRYRPGRTPHPTRDPGGHARGPARGPAAEDFAFGVDLYNRGYFWEAHEAWEGLWRAAADPRERAFLQGLILCAAAALKAAMGRWASAASLAGRAARRMAAAGGPREGIDGAAFAARVVAFVERREPAPPPLEMARPL